MSEPTELPVEFIDPDAPRCVHCGLELHPGDIHEPVGSWWCLITEPGMSDFGENPGH